MRKALGAFAALAVTACGSGGSGTAPLPAAAAPTFQPASGTYPSPQGVVIASGTAGATVRYTTDGSDPTQASSVYLAAVHVAASGTLKAFATAPDHDPSPIASATYVIAEDATLDFVTWCTSLRDTMAALQVTCNKANPAIFPDALRREFYCHEMNGEVMAGRIVVDPAHAASCLAAAASLGCAELPRGVPADCGATVAGAVAIGGICYIGDDCAGNGDCTKDDPAPQHPGLCPGVCQAAATLNQSCAVAECARGLKCVTLQGGPTCLARSGAGGSCPCLDGLWCDAHGGGPIGRCMDPKTAGACGSSPLPPDLTGDECAVGYACHEGQCTSIAGPGESCVGHPCGAGSTCTAGVCTPWPSVGQPCAGTGPCAGGYCAAGTCARYKETDEACVDHVECMHEICAGGHCAQARCF